MIYKTKADLLGKMGKSRSDVRLVDRMVHRGEIRKTPEGYEVNEKFFIKGVNEYDKNMIHDNTIYDKNITLPIQDCNELLDHLRFFYEMNLQRKSAMEEVIKMFAAKYRDLGWDAAVEKANSLMKFTPNPDEEAEVEYVGGLLS